MNPLESVPMAWRSIRGHRLRSTLTTLGVVIGVGAVITFVTLGASLQVAIIGDVAADQSPAMTVATQPEGEGGGPGFGGGGAVFTEHDVRRIEAVDGVVTVIPLGSVALSGVSYRNQSVALSSMTATSPAYFDQPGQGNFTSGGNFSLGAREVVLNERAATLFETNVSVGDSITVTYSSGETVNATVVGILAAESNVGGFGDGAGSQPRVYGPTDPFYQSRLESPSTGERQRVYPLLTVVAEDYENVDEVERRVMTYLESDSDARTLLPSSYEVTVRTNEELVEQIQDILDTFTGFITGIAVISLVVGAIGIANIMLVSVTERTREIGIMKAVGFQNRDILQLFLVEAVILGLLGSVVGIVVGILGGYVATDVLDLPLMFPLEWAGIAVVVGILVGVVAGLYPAWTGARTDPIEALRYE
ncbi:ABC transporter permease [Halorarum halophilum]|uniref:ABC transporter permease n=1 Tax=Halorarum halophilum TaxID=2743090 RepID=A0A7D5KP83_9EURY|nr:ABC transporter permease [Halobaculum halophilum]QLG29202.1 ABC transporter permease [Halobaculum halophilum]